MVTYLLWPTAPRASVTMGESPKPPASGSTFRLVPSASASLTGLVASGSF